jgi:hypothetical protein
MEGGTYHGDDILLDGDGERDELEVEGEVELFVKRWINCWSGKGAMGGANVPSSGAARERWFVVRATCWAGAGRIALDRRVLYCDAETILKKYGRFVGEASRR